MSRSDNVSKESEIYKDTVETTNSLKYALSVAYRTNETGIETAKELEKQDSQIDGMNKNLDQIDNNNYMAMRYIRSIKSSLGTFVNMFSRSPTNVVEQKIPNTLPNTPSNKGSNNTITVSGVEKEKKATKHEDENEYYYENPSNSFYNEALEYEIKEQDKDLDELYNVIFNIHGIAKNMNTELDKQNEKLKKVSGRVDEQHGKIEYSTKEITKLL